MRAKQKIASREGQSVGMEGFKMNFNAWFSQFGIDDDDLKKIALLAWRAGAYVEREAIIKRCEEFGAWNSTAQDIADDIRKRGER